MQTLKNIALTCVFMVLVYAILGGYIVAMFNGKMPMMRDKEPKPVCAVFQDGTTFGRDRVISIDAYHAKTKQSFDYQECLK